MRDGSAGTPEAAPARHDGARGRHRRGGARRRTAAAFAVFNVLTKRRKTAARHARANGRTGKAGSAS
jgi:hypothetical protein